MMLTQKVNDAVGNLATHTLLGTHQIQTIEDLRVFMEHHVYAVWDFMSLVKSLQMEICKSTDLWFPSKYNRSGAARLMNDIVLSEESDVGYTGVGATSHFDLYCNAMIEVGADVEPIMSLLDSCPRSSVLDFCDYLNSTVVQKHKVPAIALDFMNTTFSFVRTRKPHVIAAAFLYGRESVIPTMFSGILSQLRIGKIDAPQFHYYLERHIQQDEETHGPAAEELLDLLIERHPLKKQEAEEAALEAIQARIKLWDYVEAKINGLTNQTECDK